MTRSPDSRDRSRSRSPSHDNRVESPKCLVMVVLLSACGCRAAKLTGSLRAGSKEAVVFDWKTKLLDLLEDNRMSKSDLNDTTWDQLEEMGDTLASNVVQRLSESNMDRIRNFNSFTLSIMKRIKEEGPDLGKGDIRQLDPRVEDAVRDLVRDGKVYVEDFDQRIVSALNSMSNSLALQAVEKFGSSNLDGVRSKTGFMMSIIRRIKDETDGRGGYDRGYGGRDHRGGDRYDRCDRYDRGDRYDRYDRYDRDRYGGRSNDRYERDRYDRYDRDYDRYRR